MCLFIFECRSSKFRIWLNHVAMTHWHPPELLYFLTLLLNSLLLLVACPLRTYSTSLTKLTITTVSITLAIIPHCLKIVPSLLIPSPSVHWQDTSAKGTQTALCLKEGSLRRDPKLSLVPVGGWQRYWGSVDWEGTTS